MDGAVLASVVYQIPLTRGLVTLVDAEDFERFGGFRWRALEARPGFVYASRGAGGKRLYLHREILGAGPGQETDHLNHDTLDNRRANLRLGTVSDNQHNRLGANSDSSTGVRGVDWHRSYRKYQARVMVNGTRHLIGFFTSIDEASLAIEAARHRLLNGRNGSRP